MATVPTADSIGLGNRVDVSKDRRPVEGPNIELQTSAARAKAAKVSNAGETLTGLSGLLQDAQDQYRSRVDTVDRSRRNKKYKNDVTELYSTFKTTADPSNPADLSTFMTDLQKLREDTFNEHSVEGSADSIARFSSLLDSTQLASETAANAYSDDLSIKIVVDDLAEDLGPLVDQVVANPGKLTEIVKQAADLIDDRAPALTVEIETEALEANSHCSSNYEVYKHR